MKIIKLFLCLVTTISLGVSSYAESSAHRVLVKELLHSDSYTYVRFVENNTESWFATRKTNEIKVGDTVEFPDNPPIRNYSVKKLNKTFPEMRFAASWRKVTVENIPTNPQ